MGDIIDFRHEKRATLAAVIVCLVLIVAKVWGWVETSSVSLFSSLMDSSLDLVVSLFNFMAVRYAAVPADEEHRFGHYAIEDIAGLVQSAFISASAVFILYMSVNRLAEGEAVQAPAYGVGVMVFSIVMTGLLVAYQQYVKKKTQSLIIEADALHYVSDFLMNLGIILSIWLAGSYGLNWVDPLVAGLIAIYLLHGAWKIGHRSVNHLMDKEIDDEKKELLFAIIQAHPGIKGIHAFRSRASGRRKYIQFHVEIDGSLTHRQAHDIVDTLERKLLSNVPDSEIIIHSDPV